jgi:hypothetical protein
MKQIPLAAFRLAAAAALWMAAAPELRADPNPGVVEIDDVGPFSQVLAMSDVHGEHKHLTTLLTAAGVIDGNHNWACGNTLFIVVGDSIDKGPESTKVLALWIKLIPQAAAKNGRLVVLLGNHEAEFLDKPENHKAKEFLKNLTDANIKPEDVANGTDSAGYGKLMLGMPLAARVGKFIFAHAGWYPADTNWSSFVSQAQTILNAHDYANDFITGDHSILEEKEENGTKWYDDPKSVKSLESRIAALGFYGVVFGHQPKAFGFEGKLGGVDHLHIIKIDSGMAPDAEDSPGEILHFKNPGDFLNMDAPDADRIQATGDHKKLDVISVGG